MIDFCLLIAQTTQPGGSGAPAPGGDAFFRMFLPIILLVVVFYWIMIRGQRKDRQKHANMLGALKRNDRIQTIGGIIGTVVEVRDDEVVVKVDESNNVKMHFNRGAVKDVIHESATEGK